MQRAEEAHPIGADKPIARREFTQRFRAAVKQRAIANALMSAQHFPQRLGHRKRDHKIGHGQQFTQQFTQPIREPGLRLVGLAIRTVAVATSRGCDDMRKPRVLTRGTGPEP